MEHLLSWIYMSYKYLALASCYISTEAKTQESMYLIVECSTAKEMWKCLEQAYLQATKDKEFQLKQQLQNVRLETKKIDKFIKEFKDM